MFGALVKHRILGYMERGLTVTREVHSLFVEDAEGGKDRLQPD